MGLMSTAVFAFLVAKFGMDPVVFAAFLLGVDPLDPLTFVSVPVVILLTASVAAAAPAWRASRIDSAIAFRHDG
jgi:ABC-type lipoprotein release transport system permease subunit